MLCLCHVHICTCEWLWAVYTIHYMFVCVECMRRDSMWKGNCTVFVWVWERVWSVEGCGRMSNHEWTVCNGKCRWCDVKSSRNLPVDHLNFNEVNKGHRLWRSTLLYNHPPATKKEKKPLPRLLWTETLADPKDEQIHARLAVNVPECEWEAVLWRLQS